MQDIIIVGGGPAGLSAAIYAARAGRSTLLLEAEGFGGQIAYAARVENYPGVRQISGSAFASDLVDQALELGVQAELETAVGLRRQDGAWAVVTPSGPLPARCVILATGVKHRRLGLPEEEALIGEGVSYCAVCDGAFYKDKDVAVVGGGNTALQDALFLSTLCRSVTLIHRRDDFRGEARLARQLSERKNVRLLLHTVVTALKGTASLTGLTVQHVQNGERTELAVEGLFVAVGQEPNNGWASGAVSLDRDGYILADESCRASADGVFAAGDGRTKAVRQLATAAADGVVAGLAACRYLENN